MLGLLWGKPKRPRNGDTCLDVSFDRGGIAFRGAGRFAGLPAVAWLARGHEVRGRPGDAVLYLAQLEQDGIVPTLGEECILGWPEFHDLKDHPDHADGLALLDLPPTCTLTPELTSSGALSDPTFAIALAWLDGTGRPVPVDRLGGAIWERGAPSLLPAAAWRLADAVTAFAKRDGAARSRTEQERAWGRIRLLARQAGARFDGFLSRTVVLTPERLDLALRPTWQGDTQVVELVPGLSDVPSEKWLAAYDGQGRVQDHYVLTTDDGGLVRVIPSPAVQRLLTEIKRMPGRRVAGQRAKAFLRNPYAMLGEDIAEALPPDVFEAVRRQAGLSFYAFSCEALRDSGGRIKTVRLHIFPDSEDEAPPPHQDLTDKQVVKQFRDLLAKALKAEEPCVSWRGHDLDLRGDAREQLTTLTLWLDENWTTTQPSLSFEDVYDLARYGDRIAGIGIEKPVHAPYLPAASGDASWMPDTLACVVTWQPPGTAESVRIVLAADDFHQLVERTRSAEAAGVATVGMPAWPAPLTVENAQELVRAIAPAFAAPATPPPPAPEQHGETAGADKAARNAAKETLLLKSNLEQEEYVERRAANLLWEPHERPDLPRLLRPDIALKPHQLQGVAWLQHLWRHMPQVRGCVFADDMGLGKTLQMLTFIAWYLETVPTPAPVLVVAPVSLLENWGNEIRKFFAPGLRVLTLYGAALKDMRLTRDAVDEQLIARGLNKFLRPEWIGNAQIVLTTYETLRDQEFSLSAQRWGIMVCDEAQKIKTPTSLVTRAAKKQNALFRIACTGTPVENRLADLWCLFDFVQPGLLGPLASFCRTYSRPIEARTDEQLAALERLRRIIEPQVMRRMKEDVADLPPKIIDQTCRALPLSPRQSALYSQALQAYRRKVAEADGNATMVVLGMLHTLRSICAHPASAEDVATPPSLYEFRRHSPKMRWLMEQLEGIRVRDEKVIIFTEFREIQRTLQRYIGEAFGLSVTVINGDTAAQSTSGQSRQARIDAFQASLGFNVIILSTTAVGFGVNVQAASHVIHFTRPWNPAKEDQATDRAYRIGQTKPVTVYCPTVVSDDFLSFEAKLDRLLETKRELARDMLNGADDISEADWRDL